MSAIQSTADLKSSVEEAGALLQDIQDHLGRSLNAEGRVRFPRGYLHSASSHRKQMKFVGDSELRTNLSYLLILVDVYEWLLRRTDLTATAKEMVIKAAIFAHGAVAESILRDAMPSTTAKNKPFGKRVDRLVREGRIEASFAPELNWLWKVRNRMHVFLEPSRAGPDYTLPEHVRARSAVEQLCTQLGANL